MITAELDAASLARIRIAASPAGEAVSWLALTAAGRRHPTWGNPGPTARSALRDPAVAETAALTRGVLTGRYVPDFLTPKPGTADAEVTLGDQLDRIHATPASVVHHELRQLGGAASRLDPERVPALAARGLARFWSLALRDAWPSLHRMLLQERDRCAILMAGAGLGGLLGSLHDDVRWDGRSLVVDKPYVEHIAYRDAELVLVPSALAGRRLAAQLCDPQDATLAFPARLEPAQQTRGLGALLGSGRATVLQAAGSGASTQDLARSLGLAPATVSRHLHVLQQAGLVVRRRQGRRVLYAQTDIAAELRRRAS